MKYFCMSMCLLFVMSSVARSQTPEVIFPRSEGNWVDALLRTSLDDRLSLEENQIHELSLIRELWRIKRRQASVDGEITREEMAEQKKFVTENAARFQGMIREVLADRYVELVQLYNQQDLLVRMQNSKHSTKDPSFLTVKELCQKIGLSTEQNDQLAENYDDFQAKVENLRTSMADTLAVLTNKTYSDVQKILDLEQRRDFKKLIGKPVEWFRMKGDEKEFVSKVVGTLRKRTTTTAYSIDADPDFPKIINTFLYFTLKNDAVVQQLAMTSEQEKSLDEFIKKVENQSEIRTVGSSERLEDLIKGEASLPEQLQELFLDDQIIWLNQAELQLRFIEERNTFGLLNNRLGNELELSRNQIEELDELDKSVVERRLELAKKFAEDFESIKSSYVRNNFEVLTETQRQHYKLLLGIQN